MKYRNEWDRKAAGSDNCADAPRAHLARMVLDSLPRPIGVGDCVVWEPYPDDEWVVKGIDGDAVWILGADGHDTATINYLRRVDGAS